MKYQGLMIPENYAIASMNIASADQEIACRYFKESFSFIDNGELHTKHRGVKHPKMIGLHLSEDAIHMLDKFTAHAKASGILNIHAKRQDFIRKSLIDSILQILEKGMKNSV